MDTGKTKKELATEYKERKVIGGVYIIKNLQNNKILLEASFNLQGSKNRFEFAQKTGSCVNKKLQQDWNKHGCMGFVFETLEELERKDTQTEEEFREDIELLKEMWMEKLEGKVYYK